MKIGVFDSGLGGVSVLRQLVADGRGDFVYIGDNGRAPYGNKDVATLMLYTEQLLRFLKNKNVAIFVNACNSLSSLDVEKILSSIGIEKEKYFDMVGCTEKNIKSVVDTNSHVLVYATVATIASSAYQNILNTNYKVSTLASSSLAAAIENDNELVIDKELEILIENILNTKPDYLFLACTHYPLIQEKIENVLNKNGIQIKIIDPSVFVKLELERFLTGDLNIKYFTTKLTPQIYKYTTGLPNVHLELTDIA